MLSVITITYNNLPELKKTLNSLPDFNIIESAVINGGINDDTIEFLKSYKGIVVTEKDEGISDAFNKGIAYSTGDYIMFLNSGDELLDEEYLKKASGILDNNPDYSFVHSNLLFVDKDGTELFLRPRLKNVGRGMPYLHPTMIVRREVFSKIGGFKEEIKIAMDYDWIVRLVKEKFKGYYLDQDAPVKMDGSGKSVVREGEALKECYDILKANDYLNFENLTGFIIRYFLYLGRYLMNSSGLDKILMFLKKIKHSR